MKLITSILATYLTFVYGQLNDTMPPMDMSSTMDMTSTMLYTSSTQNNQIATNTLPDKIGDGDDPTNDDEDCPNFVYMGTLVENEDIEVTICGYTEGEGDEAVDMVGITIQLPKDIWCLIGMRNEMYDPESTEEKLRGYNILIPLYSRDFQEIYYDDDGNADDLQLSLTTYSDITDNGMRVVRFTREAVVDYGTLGGDESSDLVDSQNGKYFAFDDQGFVVCQSENTFTATYANKPNTEFDIGADIETYANKFAKAATPDEVDEETCNDDSSANYIPILVALCIGIIVVLF